MVQEPLAHAEPHFAAEQAGNDGQAFQVGAGDHHGDVWKGDESFVARRSAAWFASQLARTVMTASSVPRAVDDNPGGDGSGLTGVGRIIGSSRRGSRDSSRCGGDRPTAGATICLGKCLAQPGREPVAQVGNVGRRTGEEGKHSPG